MWRGWRLKGLKGGARNSALFSFRTKACFNIFIENVGVSPHTAYSFLLSYLPLYSTLVEAEELRLRGSSRSSPKQGRGFCSFVWISRLNKQGMGYDVSVKGNSVQT
ncbi:hypothetical protein VNO77_25694 [Canavalia gladiata]|uniref:Uncharacterized protein n=1 Tax=Canavalia gladiata TaxID=3824 RepID=A0AAN9L941_CANGL